MPEYEFWPIGASLAVLLVAYAAYAFWWLMQPTKLHYTVPATYFKLGPHEVILDTQLPTRHRLIVTRTAVDSDFVYSAYAERQTPRTTHHSAVDIDMKQPAVLELPPLCYPRWPTLPDQKLTVTLTDNPNGAAKPVFRRFYLADWRHG